MMSTFRTKSREKLYDFCGTLNKFQ